MNNDKLDGKSANDICGMFVDEYLDEGSASGYWYMVNNRSGPKSMPPILGGNRFIDF